ncbi:MAG: 30S ribosomal protein THX [Ignavibacteria bacterium CG08_land_8_20_14_0_20_37_9]|nr:MAG: 30S ribosomal protein THX [Ignavibacteria bacterium CG08_land_8_20_14_0_20_37_9]
MGKGDRRSKRGKIWRSSHGKTRPWKKKKKNRKQSKASSRPAPAAP